LNYDNDVEERVLASYSLLHLTKISGTKFWIQIRVTAYQRLYSYQLNCIYATN
jgi:hypothetical protein